MRDNVAWKWPIIWQLRSQALSPLPPLVVGGNAKGGRGQKAWERG